MKFTYHKTYYFKLDNSVVLSILTKLHINILAY